MNAQQQCQNILETYGAETANKATKILLEDLALKKMQTVTDFISKTWHDPLTPAMMNLSCQAVGGNPKDTQEVAIALSLMNLSMRTWDDIIDKTPLRRFNKTTVGKFGESAALIIGGMASAKAFTILNQIELTSKKRQTMAKLFWNYLAKMAEAEIIDQNVKIENYSSKDKISKIKAEAINLETCLKLGAILGNGSRKEINALGRYGKTLGIIVELWKDLIVSLNLTLELDAKIRQRKLPYFLLMAKDACKQTQEELELMSKKKTIEPDDIGFIVKKAIQYTQAQAMDNIDCLTKKALYALNGFEGNNGIKKLRFFVGVQPQIFQDCLKKFNCT